MSRQISPATHARIALNNPDTFAKSGESQEAAIKRFMRNLRTNQRRAETRVFPNDVNSLGSTRAYVETYYGVNFGSRAIANQLFENLADTPALWPETDEVEVEELLTEDSVA
jgi:hypothetical protein